ncbi:MAG: hypothetical protein IKY24_03300, partial [Alistipes sp.]|nr:hypothetical protein [Alistipes sp.]
MKRLFLAVVSAMLVVSVSAAPKKQPKVDYVDALQLTMIGKLCETTNPYHRIEVAAVPELSKGEARLL